MENIVVLKDPLRQKFLDILKSNGVNEDVDQITLNKPKELQGEHYTTETYYATVVFKDQSVPNRNLFVKKLSDNEMHAAMLKTMGVMQKETAVFTKFLPAVQEFCKKNGEDTLLDFFPKCLYGDEDILVQDNLVLNDGWIMLPKEDKQDLTTAKIVLGRLAKLHGVSHAFIKEECGGYDQFLKEWETITKEGFDPDNPMLKGVFDNGLNTCVLLLNGNPGEGHDEVSATLAVHLGRSYGIVSDIIQRKPEDKFLVLNHGDCWNNNMLFKKDPKTGELTEHIFVDLQMTRLGSPNLDISYFLYNSVKQNVRDEHILELLQHYYDSLEEVLKLFGKKCPWTFKEFVVDYKKRSLFGLFSGLIMISTHMGMKDLDMSTLGGSLEEMMESIGKLIAKWIADNPEGAKNLAIEIVQTVKEHGKMIEAKV